MPDISDKYNRAQQEVYDEYNSWATEQGYTPLYMDEGPFGNPFSTMAAGQYQGDMRSRMDQRFSPAGPPAGYQSNPMTNIMQMLSTLMQFGGGNQGPAPGQPGGGYRGMNKNQANLLNRMDMGQ